MKHFNTQHFLAALSASIGSGFQHGYHDVVITVAREVFFRHSPTPVTPFFQPIQEWVVQNKKDRSSNEPTDQEIKWIWSLLVSVFSLGGILGSSLTACFAKAVGRRNGLLINNCTLFIATVFLCLARYANMYEVLIVGRFLIGINAGLNSGLCPIFLSEISTVSLRGASVALYIFVYTASLSLSFILCLHQLLGNSELWPYLFSVSIIPAMFQILVLSMCPESSRVLLISYNDEERARKSLMWYRNSDDVLEEFEELKELKKILTTLVPPASLKALFTDSLYRTPLIIAIFMVLGQHGCGVYTAVYYSADFMIGAEILPSEVSATATILGLMLLLSSFASIMLIEVLGRRLLFLLSLCGLAFDTIFLALMIQLSKDEVLKDKMDSMVSSGMILFAGWYGLGFATVPIVTTVELFHHLARPIAVSVVMPVSWLSNFIIQITYMKTLEKLGIYIFVGYVLIDLMLYLFVHIFLPETKGKTSREIIELFYFLGVHEHRLDNKQGPTY